MKIVCVDDHPIMLKGLEKDLYQIMPEAEIYCFNNADDALCLIKKNGCDVLFCEIELYGKNGILLAHEIQKLNQHVNIIFVTVCDEKEYAKEVMKLKPSGYLTKPATREQIREELKNLRYQINL